MEQNTVLLSYNRKKKKEKKLFVFFFLKPTLLHLDVMLSTLREINFIKKAPAILLLLIFFLCNSIALPRSEYRLARPDGTMLISLQNIAYSINARRHESCGSSPGIAKQASSVVVECRIPWDGITHLSMFLPKRWGGD